MIWFIALILAMGGEPFGAVMCCLIAAAMEVR
jgi:hypothetical protein